MPKKTTRESLELLLNKKPCYIIKVTSYIKGANKNNFIDDCISRRIGESKMNQHIVNVYYTIMNDVEMIEIKKIINERIKL